MGASDSLSAPSDRYGQNDVVVLQGLKAPAILRQIENDIQEALAAGVSGTPAFFINGVSLSGARSPEDFYRTIDIELERLKEGA